MANKKAPYKDKEVLKDLVEFYKHSSTQAILHSVAPLSEQFRVELYENYLRWQIEHPNLILKTLNERQFDKAFAVVVVMEGK